ncbi:hypothetical protein [Thalassoglobus polymorphus]|uniref:Uncharacterized protein n=1 Tax=Thalassoglobus polymorphus TaxID=2527994 RepID=A0A517QIX1_9PLAN|nr:hypothetical protein [Thalassoglobus polymorphus]QDT31477.1 hypothetical protein Mal48_07110 [Thalassoglobus polymorphus]
MAQMRKVSRGEVLDLAEKLAEDYGESLTLTAFRRETGLSQHVIFDLFGNWKNLRTEVGLTPEAPRARNKISKNQILKLMTEQVAEHGENLTEVQFLHATGLSGRMIMDRFGSWGDLRESVGLSRRARLKTRYSEQDLYDDLYRVYRIFRERPNYNKHRYRGGLISPGTICHRFTSWEWACLRFRDYLKSHDLFNSKMPLPEQLEQEFREREEKRLAAMR